MGGGGKGGTTPLIGIRRTMPPQPFLVCLGEDTHSGGGKPGASSVMAPGFVPNFPSNISVATKGPAQVANYFFEVALGVSLAQLHPWIYIGSRGAQAPQLLDLPWSQAKNEVWATKLCYLVGT